MREGLVPSAGAVARLGALALETDDFAVLLDQAAILTPKALGVEHGGICEWLSVDGEFVIRNVFGWPRDVVGLRLPAGTSHSGYAIATGEPVVSNDIQTEERYDVHDLWHRNGIRSAIAVPIPGLEAPFGVLCAQSAEPNAFDETDVHVCQAIAHVIAGAEIRRDALVKQRQSERLDALGRLAGTIAHDFKNLLAVVSGFVMLAAKRTTDDRVLGFLSEAQTACDRATALTQQLLTFARTSEPVSERFSIPEAIVEMLPMVEQAVGANVHVRLDADEEVSDVFGDLTQFEQVIMNLTINARDAMPSGGSIVITVGSCTLGDAFMLEHPSVQLAQGNYIRIEFADTGVGMSEEVRARVFDPFFSTKPKDEGTGLGLATVYGAVSQAGGMIDVRSELGVGTTFEILLPAAERAKVEKRSNAASTDMDITVVEDNVQLRSLISRILEENGFAVTPVGSATEAFHVLSLGHRPDVMIVDLVLPGASGWRVIEEAANTSPPVPCVLMSGYATAGLEGRAAGSSVAFLQKPFSEEELLAAIAEVRQRSSADRSRGSLRRRSVP